MERHVYEKLKEWKENPDRKPLILDGARQVGKTWIVKEFGKREFSNFIYVNCDNNPDVSNLFSDFDVERIFRVLSALSGKPVIAGETLIFLDEIQELPLGLTALKYFCENARDQHIIVAGSLLGIAMHGGTGFPVGKHDHIRLYPMDFKEFLSAMGREQLVDVIEEHRWSELSDLRATFIELLRQYYYVGGMPEVVELYRTKKDLKGVRSIQRGILSDYREDFSKHAPADEVPRINQVWDAVPGQLAKENKKFVYRLIKKGARSREYEKAIQWLLDAGLLYRVNRVSKVAMPLKFYEDMCAFKLFVNDLGLLGAMADVSASQVLVKDSLFMEYKGAFTEQYVAQEYFAAMDRNLYYYTNENSTSELDFVTQADIVHPIEVKAEENLRSKSLSSVLQKDASIEGWRFSMSDYREQDQMKNIPLYLVGEWFRANL